jgi:hypothetical protein
MVDTNGDVAPEHLGTFQGVTVSVAILPDLRAASDEFRQYGHTFTLILPDGGYRSLATQEDEHLHPAAHNINPAMVKLLAPVGHSSHGFGRAVDVYSNATLAVIAQIMSKHGFHHPFSWDPHHWEWGNALTPADVSTTSLDSSSQEETPMFKYLSNGVTGAKARYVLVSPFLPGGALVVSDIAVARGFAALAAPAGSAQLGPTVVSDADLDQALAVAKQNVYTPGTGGGGSNADVVAAIQDLSANLIGKIPTIPTQFTTTWK